MIQGPASTVSHSTISTATANSWLTAPVRYIPPVMVPGGCPSCEWETQRA